MKKEKSRPIPQTAKPGLIRECQCTGIKSDKVPVDSFTPVEENQVVISSTFSPLSFFISLRIAGIAL